MPIFSRFMVLLALLCAVSNIRAEDADSSKKDPKDMNADECETAGLCPVSKKPSKLIYHFAINEKLYHFCCRECFTKFAANPKAYLTNSAKASGGKAASEPVHMNAPIHKENSGDRTIASPGAPVGIPHLPESFTSNVAIMPPDSARWARIAPLPAPYSGKSAGSLKLAWRDDGLYGFAEIKDSNIEVDALTPWTRDCIELWLDVACARAPQMLKHSHQIVLAPDLDKGAGPCLVSVPQSSISAASIRGAWKPIADGYILEFLISANDLDVKLGEGSKMGLNYAVDKDGKAVEEFYADKDTNSSFNTPDTWGVIELKK